MLHRLAPIETKRSFFLADLLFDLWALSDGSRVCIRTGVGVARDIAVFRAQGAVDHIGDRGELGHQRLKEGEVRTLDEALTAQAAQVASPPR